MENKIKNNYSIGVVTYVARYDKYFIPLIKQLTSVFPDKEIICTINGHPDTSLQIEYLKNVTAFLSQFSNIKYITYEKHQPIARCWNWLVLMSFSSAVLILNDDIKVNLLFRKDFEKSFTENQDFFIINNSWSHFLISKKIIKEIGWFEERLLGSGDEDGDYITRMAIKDMKVTNRLCGGIINYVAEQKNAGWKNISGVGHGKYSEINKELMSKKWSPDYFKEKGAVLTKGMETPIFYDFSCLDAKNIFPLIVNKYNQLNPKSYLKFLIPLNVIYSFFRKFGGNLYRFVKKKIKISSTN